MTVQSAQSVTVLFTTRVFATGVGTNADSLPTGTLYVNGTANGATVTVTNISTGLYKAAVTLPTLAIKDEVQIIIAATVSTIADTCVIWTDTKDVLLDSSGDVTFNNTSIATVTTVTTATNLTNAPTAGDFTAAMKTSLSAATPAVTVSDKTGFSLTAAYDFAKGTTAMTESYAAQGATMTPVQALYQINQHLGESSIASTTKTVKKRDASTTAKTFTLNDATTPTAITEAT